MMGFGLMGLGLLIPLFLVAVIAYALGWRPGGDFDSRTGTSLKNRRSALDLLEERYARGEISQDEFHEIRRNLES